MPKGKHQMMLSLLALIVFWLCISFCIWFAFLKRFLRCIYFREDYFVCWGWNCSQEQSKFSLTLKSFWLQSKDWVIIVIIMIIKYIWAIQIVDSSKDPCGFTDWKDFSNFHKKCWFMAFVLFGVYSILLQIFMEILGMRRISKFIVYIHFDLTKWQDVPIVP